MNFSTDHQQGAARKVRAMLQIHAWCELPAYVSEAEHFPFGQTTASVPEDSLKDLECHPGVIALWLQTEGGRRRESKGIAPRVEMSVPAELTTRFAELFPTLVDRGVRRMDVFSYARPGERPYWMAFLLTEAGRHTLGTPDMRHMPLDLQAEDLARQLDYWTPGPQADPELRGGFHEE
jgi:hypothetical protein